ncbi:MAG: hypothetical protein LBH35_01240, partial [Treponema sp.]|nr:hypothetical protein [Treponema sp.]
MLIKIRKTAVLPFTCGTTTSSVAEVRFSGQLPNVNLHAYHYAGNNPVKLTDPTGRDLDWSIDFQDVVKGFSLVTDLIKNSDENSAMELSSFINEESDFLWVGGSLGMLTWGLSKLDVVKSADDFLKGIGIDVATLTFSAEFNNMFAEVKFNGSSSEGNGALKVNPSLDFHIGKATLSLGLEFD